MVKLLEAQTVTQCAVQKITLGPYFKRFFIFPLFYIFFNFSATFFTSMLFTVL